MPFLSKGKIKTAFTVQFCFNSTNKWDTWEKTVSQGHPSLLSYQFHVQSVTKTGLTGTVPMSTAIWVLCCFKFQSQKGTLGTKLDTRSILCFIHEKLSLERFIFAYSIGNQIFQVFKLQLDVLNYKTLRPIAQWNMKTSGGLNLWLLKVLK